MVALLLSPFPPKHNCNSIYRNAYSLVDFMPDKFNLFVEFLFLLWGQIRMRGGDVNMLNDANYSQLWLSFESGICIEEHSIMLICKLFDLQKHIFRYQP